MIHHSTIWFALAFSFTTSSYNHLEPIIGGTSRTGVRLVERPMLVYLNAVGCNVDADAVAVDIAADDGDDDDDDGGGGRNNNNYFTVCVYDFFAQYVCMCGSKFVLNHSESTARHGARTQDVPQTHSLSLSHTHTHILLHTHTYTRWSYEQDVTAHLIAYPYRMVQAVTRTRCCTESQPGSFVSQRKTVATDRGK